MTLEEMFLNWNTAPSTCWQHATPEQIHECVNNGANVHARIGLFRHTPLHRVAMLNPNPDVIYALIDRGAWVNRRCLFCMQTPLHFAVKHNVSPVIMALLNRNANRKLKDLKGRTALTIAKKRQFLINTEALEKLHDDQWFF